MSCIAGDQLIDLPGERHRIGDRRALRDDRLLVEEPGVAFGARVGGVPGVGRAAATAAFFGSVQASALRPLAAPAHALHDPLHVRALTVAVGDEAGRAPGEARPRKRTSATSGTSPLMKAMTLANVAAVSPGTASPAVVSRDRRPGVSSL